MINLNGIRLKNRFLVSAGALEYGRGWPWERPLIKFGLVKPSIFGAIVTKTLTLKPRTGNYINPFEFEKRSLLSHFCHIISSETRRVLRKVPGGWINNMGWWNVGIDCWIKEIYPNLKDIAIIPNVGGFSTEDYLALIEKLNPLAITAIELDVSCPNLEGGPRLERKDLPWFFREARRTSRHPLILKIGHSEDDIQLAQTAQALGINAISAINAVPVLGGGYSGPGIKYIALKAVNDLRKIVKIPVIGGGGVSSWQDCQDLFQAGADAVSIGSMHILQPWKPTLIVRFHR